MRKNFLMLFSFIILSAMVAANTNCSVAHPKPETYDGWQMGVQTWTFNRFTLFEAIDKTRSLGLNGIQAFSGQKVSADIEVQFGPGLTDEQKQAVKDKLHDAGLTLYAFGVVDIPVDEAAARKLFGFAREMGIETLASEPSLEQFDLIDKLCQEYRIKLAIHNHPKPSKYWNPDTVLEACEGRSQWIGACTDVGHWVRSGLDPVKCLKKLQGRIHDVHIKDIDEGHDVIWGTGQGQVKGILEELHRQEYKGTFSIEYEYHWDNNVPEIRQSLGYFNSVAQNLNPTGWKPIFDETLSNADFKDASWAVKDGILTRQGGSDIWTKDAYSNFILDFEFKLAEGTNSGVFLRTANHNWLPWVEVQIEDSSEKSISKHVCGGIFDIKEPTVNVVKKPGQWNHMTITANGSNICVVLNHQTVVQIDLNDWTQAHQNPDGTKNKFDIAYKDLPKNGWIGFQDHGQDIWYRNIKIKEL